MTSEFFVAFKFLKKLTRDEAKNYESNALLHLVCITQLKALLLDFLLFFSLCIQRLKVRR